MLTYDELSPLIGNRNLVDAVCPACSPFRKTQHRRLKVLRIWRIDDGLLSFNCAHCEASGYAHDGDRSRPPPSQRSPEAIEREMKRKAADQAAVEQQIEKARRLWAESLPVEATRAADYLNDRGLSLPADPEIRDRTLRFHPHCPFPDQTNAPALLVAFTPIEMVVPDDPFDDPPPRAIHRIRGRGHGNKFMLGPVRGCAMMISPWWQVYEHLHVCEGVETALSLYGEEVRPIWALGSAGAIASLPVVERVQHLTIWADNDENGTGLTAAKQCRDRWVEAGKIVTVRMSEGSDYAD
jgi:hypothetical protein